MFYKAHNIMFLRCFYQILMMFQELRSWLGDQDVEFTLNGVLCDRVVST